jgi:hypothetical protein
MDLYEVGKDIQSLKDRLERLESASKPCILNAESLKETSPLKIPDNYVEVAEVEIKNSARTLVTKTFKINIRKRADNGESREGSITISPDGSYDGRVNFRCNCSFYLCACNFDSARIEFRNNSNVTVVSVPFDPDAFDLGQASDSDRLCKGWNPLIAQAYDQIVYADPMFRSN